MSRTRKLLTRSVLAGLVPAVLLLAVGGSKPLTMRGVTVRASHSAADRTIDAVLSSVIATPFGRHTVNARVHLVYDCTAAFRADVNYHPLVRLMASLKGMRLVHSFDGVVEVGLAEGAPCVAMPGDSLVGEASVDSLSLTGALAIGADSVQFGGPAWLDENEETYHAILTTAQPNCLTVRLNLHVGPRRRPAVPRA